MDGDLVYMMPIWSWLVGWRGFDKIGVGRVRGGSSNWKSEILDFNMLKSKINIVAPPFLQMQIWQLILK